MMAITLATTQAIMSRQAEALGGSWTASTGAEEAWGVERYPYSQLSDGREVVIRIWISGSEALLSVEVASEEFEEANGEVWGFGEEFVEAVVAALARRDFEVHERYVRVKAGRKGFRLTKWPPGSKVPGVGR